MITRIVRLSFCPEFVSEFQEIFSQSEAYIRSFSGCSELRLLSDYDHPGVFFTYSTWDSMDSLNQYRDSELFRSVWKKVKPGFNAAPQAFSLLDHSV